MTSQDRKDGTVYALLLKMRPYLADRFCHHLLQAGFPWQQAPDGDMAAIVTSNDGLRPVSFKPEAVEE